MAGRGGVDVVKVKGLAELQRELKAIDLAKDLRKANKDAAEIVAEAARAKALSLGGVAAKTAPSIKAAGEQRNSKVTVGGPKYPFSMGAEFGSIEFTQFDGWRGNGSSAGYFLYPAIRSTREEFIKAYGDEIERLMRKAFPD